MSKRLIVILAVIWMIVLVAGTASSLTLALCGVSVGILDGHASARDHVLVSSSEYDTIQRYARLEEIREIVEEDYYLPVDEEALMTGAMRGMLDALEDPYTFYYTEEEMSASNEHHEGHYEGVGMQVLASEEGEIIITRAFKDGPAWQAGITSGDRIVAVDGTPVNASTTQALNDAVDMIKGEVGTEVTLTIERAGVPMDFVLERRGISINRVEYTMLDDDVGYIILYEFVGDVVDGFNEALKALGKQGAKGYILDVRSNPGGLLDDVVKIADRLLPEGMIVYIENRAGERDTFYSDKGALGLPLVVLVNEMSASASELLAGAVQDTGVGKIVGNTTFGKGIVQTVISFSDGSGIQLTTSRYFTPGGRCIHGSGIEPDVEVDIGDYDFTISGPDAENDPQLKEALSVLRKEMDER